MKCSLVLLACIGVVLARPEPPSSMYGPPGGGYPRGGPGGGSHSGGGGGDEHSAPANYNFAYEVKDAESGNDFGHMENRMGHVAMGSYHVLLPDGRMQKVDYVADKDGYRPTVTYTGEAKFGTGVGGVKGVKTGGTSGTLGTSYGPPDAAKRGSTSGMLGTSYGPPGGGYYRR